MFTQKDVLLRQIEALGQAAAAMLTGRAVEDDDVVAEAIAASGLTPSTAARLSPDGLIALLSGPEGLDTRRALLLGLGCAVEAGALQHSDADLSKALAERARALIRAATDADRTLLTAGVQQALTALQ